jgi:hypothetical protein
MYAEFNKVLVDKQLDHALIAIGITIANLSYQTRTPILQLLALINRTAVENFEQILEEENESTKH